MCIQHRKLDEETHISPVHYRSTPLSTLPLPSPPHPSLLPTGDYVILISTGLSWYTALLFNFISALTAIIGFFVGVAIGTESEEVNGWVLAFAAGLFIYIALVDLVRGLPIAVWLYISFPPPLSPPSSLPLLFSLTPL